VYQRAAQQHKTSSLLFLPLLLRRRRRAVYNSLSDAQKQRGAKLVKEQRRQPF
jgi:hypothetical protein